MRQFIHVILVNLLIIQSFSQQVFAGAEGQAREYVATSQQAAREHAKTIFMDYLKDITFNLGNSVETVQKVKDAGAAIGALDKQILDLAYNLSITSNDKDLLDPSEFSSLIEKMMNLTVEIKAAEYTRDYRILEQQGYNAELSNLYSDIFSSIKKQCSAGVASSFNTPNLPPVKAIPPIYSISFGVGYNGKGTYFTNPEYNVTGGEDNHNQSETKEAIIGTSVAVGTVAGLYLTTGKLMLTQTAMAGATTAQMASAMAVGVGVGLVVAAVMYAVEMDKAMKQSREISDAMWIVFNEKADSQTVANEFKNLCTPLVAALDRVPLTIKSIEDQDPVVAAQFEKMKERVKLSLESKSALEEKVAKKLKSLTEESLAQEFKSDEERENWVHTELSKTTEYLAYVEFLKTIPEDQMYEVLEVALVDYNMYQNDIELQLKASSESLFKRSVDDYVDEISKLISIARAANKNTQKKRQKIQNEIQLYKELGNSYREFDASFAQYIREMFVLGQTVQARARLNNWIQSVEALKSKYPHSTSVADLSSRASALFKHLGLDGK